MILKLLKESEKGRLRKEGRERRRWEKGRRREGKRERQRHPDTYFEEQ